MVKNSEVYKKANDQIKAEEKLKRMTRNRILEEKDYHPSRMVLKLANSALVILLVFSIAWLTMTNKNQEFSQPESILGLRELELPRVKDSQTLISMLENTDRHFDFLKESTMATDSVQESAKLDYSRTNEQVEGVSEADCVKTDGQYLYSIGENKLSIIKAQNMQIISQMDYKDKGFRPSGLLLQENHLVVIGEAVTQMQEEFNYYDICYMGNVVAIVYDISQKEAIVEKRKIELDGHFLDVRMIEDTVYLIANKYVYLTEEKKNNPELLKPCYLDTTTSEEKQTVEFADIYYFPEEMEENNYLTIASFSVKDSREAKIDTYLGAGSNIYCSKENLYITRSRAEFNIIEQAKVIMGFRDYTTYTEIYRFHLKNGKAVYEAHGKVPGYVINQFAMDEKNGYFRIATTQGLEENQSNAIYILNQDLNRVGALENLAKGESIYAVRYQEDTAYMVTFEQVDPLFVIDLSNPYAPMVLGELKIPGFSNYLHPYDEKHIIGIGKDTQEKNGNVTTLGMKVSIFDVEEINNPKEMYTITIGENGTYSEALYNHKAVLFSKEKNLLAFPISIMEREQGKTKITLQGAIVYDISLENGLIEKGRIHCEEENIQRCLYIEDILYVCGSKTIRAFDLNTMQEIAKVEM